MVDIVNNMKNANFYFVTHAYVTFQKEQIELISNMVNKTLVFSRTNNFLNLFNTSNSSIFKRYSPSYKMNIVNIPPGCNVFSTPVYYVPVNFDYLRMGERHFKAVMQSIKQNAVEPPSLIHTHFLWSAGYVGMRLKEEYDVPFVVTGHGYDVYDLPFRSDAWKTRICQVLNAADHVITVSKSNLACLQKLDVETPISVIPNGFDDKLFYPRDTEKCRQKLGLPLEKKILLTVGNCVAIKGHRYLIEAMKKIHDLYPDVLCIIVGSGELYAKEQGLIDQLGVSDCVRMIGGKPHEEIPLWMNACDLFVLPSLNEGNPTVLVECLGCGKPFIGTRVGGIPEMISSDEYGLVCEPGDTASLALCLDRAIKVEWNSKKIHDYALNYTWDNLCKEIIGVYNKYL